ncbi:MAG: ABC transporter substrate-binding protein [Mariprofundaceae bacterium]|nr:ABC transporter substrate-binding protein [Mariprofundaceae bacterium]
MKALFRFIILALIATMFSACSSDEPKPLLKVGLNQWVGYQPMLLARSLGFYDKKQIKLAELPSTTDAIHLLQAGELDAAALTLDEALLVIDHGTALTVVLVFDSSEGADVLIARPNIKHLQALKGKRIGVESSAVGNMMLHSILKKAKLNEQDVHIVYLTLDEHVSAYKNGEVDAVITFEPSRTHLLKMGGHELFTSRMIPNLIIDVLAVRTDQLQKQHANIQTLIDGYYKARHQMATKTADAMQRMAPSVGMTPTELQASFKGLKLPSLAENKALFSGQPSPFEKSAHIILKTLQDTGEIDQPLNLTLLQNSTFLNAVQP